jgi:hypothetical protein
VGSNIIQGDGFEWNLESSYAYNYLWQIPQFVALVRLGEPSTSVGSPQTVNIFGSGGAEVLQKVTPEPREVDEEEETYEVEMVYNNTHTTGGILAIAYPNGATPTLANVRILGIEVGVTGSGSLTVSFPVGQWGPLENWTFAFVYFQNDPLRVNIVGHLPGPNGAAISEALEDDLGNLVLPVNDNFDEKKRTGGLLQEDRVDDKIATQADHDFIRLKLTVAPGLTKGVASLVFRPGYPGEDVGLYLRFYSADGQTLIDPGQLSVDLAQPQGPLVGITSSSGVSLLIEARNPRAAIELALQYVLNDSVVLDTVRLHAIDVDFLETSGPGALDDDDENSANPQRWAMMVPLSAGEQSSGSGEVRVTVAPASLASNLTLAWAGPGAPSTFGPVTLSGEQTLTIGGNQSSQNHPLKVTWTPNGQVIDGLNVDFVARRPRDPTKKLKVALWRIGLTTSTVPTEPYSASAVIGFLNETWRDQANVHFEIIGDWQSAVVTYDLNGDGALSSQNNFAEYAAIRNGTPHASADINLYHVSKMTDQLGAEVLGNAYIANQAETTTVGVYIKTPLSIVAHEFGHTLGLNAVAGEGHDVEDRGEVMSAPQNLSLNPRNIRKYDWRVVNPEVLP